MSNVIASNRSPVENSSTRPIRGAWTQETPPMTDEKTRPIPNLEAPPQPLAAAQAEAAGGLTLCHEGIEIQVVAGPNPRRSDPEVVL